MHSMNPPIVRDTIAFVSCGCGWSIWVQGIKLEETDQTLNYTLPAEVAWIDHMEQIPGRNL